jgi:hypothetical protein
VKTFARTIRVAMLAAACAACGSAFSQTTATPPAENQSALTALKLLPQDKAAGVARIVGRDGTPAPERWHFITHDPAEANGLREFVVARGVLVAARSMSQFASEVKAADVLGIAGVKVDSRAAGEIAKDYALANNAALSTMNYELCREGAEAAPVWKVTCHDSQGKQLGFVTLTASKGTVVAHDGFPLEPKPAATGSPAVKLDTYAEEKVAPEKKITAVGEGPKKTTSHRRKAKEEDEHVLGKVGGSIKNLFTGKLGKKSKD